MTTKGIYHTLVTQLDKLARHNRQGSFRTKDRYYEAVKRFCVYLAAHYHLRHPLLPRQNVPSTLYAAG